VRWCVEERRRHGYDEGHVLRAVGWGPKHLYASVCMKLIFYDDSTCLEAYLANVKNFEAFL